MANFFSNLEKGLLLLLLQREKVNIKFRTEVSTSSLNLKNDVNLVYRFSAHKF